MRKTLAEKAKLVPAIVLVGILVFSSLSSLGPNQRWTAVSTISTAKADSTQTALRNAVNYLYNNYNKGIGLIRESPDYPNLINTYNIYSDNYLASLVLRDYDQRMAKNITSKMTLYLDRAKENNSTLLFFTNQYMVLDESVSAMNDFAFNNASDVNLTKDINLPEVDGATINTTINNGSDRLDPKLNADIAFLQAIYNYTLGNESGAMSAYIDGVNQSVNLSGGLGFNDSAFRHDLKEYGIENYQTYKLALYIYASKLLRQENYSRSAFDVALYTLPKMQARSENLSDGGFSTGYDSSLQAIRGPNGTNGTNTETTSLAILALNTPPIASFSVTPDSGNISQVFSVDASASSDLEDASGLLEVRWDWNDDGTWDTDWSTEKTAQWQYSEPGLYTVRLEVRDTQGLTNSTTMQVEVIEVVPEFSMGIVPVLSLLFLVAIVARSRPRRDMRNKPG